MERATSGGSCDLSSYSCESWALVEELLYSRRIFIESCRLLGPLSLRLGSVVACTLQLARLELGSGGGGVEGAWGRVWHESACEGRTL